MRHACRHPEDTIEFLSRAFFTPKPPATASLLTGGRRMHSRLVWLPSMARSKRELAQ
jgi:hypothetical protein